MSTVHETYGSGGSFCNATDFYAGLECEIEGVKAAPAIVNFETVPDGSLREGGMEFVTVTPQQREQLVQNFKLLHTNLQYHPNAEPFSDRTSTHVHVNISSLQEKQVRTMILLYALFEEFFFAMVKPNRRDNIHCVPLTETYLPSKYASSLDGLFHQWHKYTALNLKRMTDLGTLEFRHLHGTGDVAELNTWLHVLENLWKLSQRVEITEETLSDKKVIEEWFDLIFFPADKIIMLRPSLFEIIRNSIVDVKFSLI